MILVLGAGYGGLATAALLAHRGREVTVLESHETLGGCAGFFRTGRYSYDVGATTFSGVLADQPVGMVFGELGITPALVRQDPGMIVRMGEREVVRHAGKEAWIEGVSQMFPQGDQQGFWNKLYEIEARIWPLIRSFPSLPPSSLLDWLRLAHPRGWKYASLGMGLITSMRSLAASYGVLSDAAFASFLNEQLLISTQSTMERAPWVTGAMGLTYPSQTYYPLGGMYRPALQLMRHVQNRGGTVRFRERVVNIDRIGSRYRVRTDRGTEYQADTVISSIPVWNMAEITSGPMQRYFAHHAQRYSHAWCAISVYFALDGQSTLPTTYYQIHLDTPLPYVHAGSLFVTVSPSYDEEKAPHGHCTVTVSTHARAADWEGLSEHAYLEQKRMVEQAILDVIDARMPEFAGMQRMHVESGMPSTWVRYTSRHRGYVGGLPHDIGTPLLRMPPNRTPFAGLYHVGDTAFPGQGTPAVMLGAWNAAYLCTL